MIVIDDWCEDYYGLERICNMLILTCVHDKAASCYTVFSPFQTEVHAVRAVQDILLQENTFSNHPEDFDLIMIGYLDEESGVVQPCAHKILYRFSDFYLTKGVAVGEAEDRS